MPSFSYEVKEELLQIKNVNDCCNIAQLNAMLKVGGVINGNRIDFITVHAAIARKVLKLIKFIYSDVKAEVAVVRHKKFWTRNRYVVRIFLDAQTEFLFKSMKNNKFPRSDCCKSSYLRGLFLAAGSVSRPESHYHFEIFTFSKNIAAFIEKNLQKIDIPVKSFERRDRFVVYLQDYESICDVLYLINAENALERFEIAKNLKEVRINVNRITNCDNANLQKAVDAAQRQLSDIKIIQERGLTLDSVLTETVLARLQNPSSTIPELAEKLFVSPSCLKHRFKKIHDLANS